MTTKANIQQQALSNAQSGASTANYKAIFDGFVEMGIPAELIVPRVNVLTFDAWLAVGRCVRRGQHGVSVVTVIDVKDKKTGEVTGKRPKRTTVFHISQTDALDGSETTSSETPNADTPVNDPVHDDEAAPALPSVRDLNNNYAARIEERRERYEDKAEALANQANATHDHARKMASVIPFGQPILVGHHSERGDRRYRSKIENTFRKSFELDNTAKHYAEKAKTVGTGGISSDDPEALTKLREQLAADEAMQERMKKANACVRRKDRDGLVALGFAVAQVEELFKPDFCGRIGFADYQLTNNSANIRRLKQRVAAIESVRRRDDVEQTGNGYVYREDVNENRVMFEFDGKPAAHVRDVLKREGFKWSPNRGAWVRKLNNAGLWAGKEVRKALDAQA